jgi:hypothetical protein
VAVGGEGDAGLGDRSRWVHALEQSERALDERVTGRGAGHPAVVIMNRAVADHRTPVYDLRAVTSGRERNHRVEKHRVAVNVALATVSIILLLLAIELMLRQILFHPVRGFGRLRDPGRYADYFSEDDYWKLYVLLGTRWRAPAEPHPVLGWVGNFDRETYIHNDFPALGGRRAVLLYGDSFAECTVNVLPGHPEQRR